MDKIAGRWYVGLIIIPVLINYLTSYWALPEILEDWKITVVGMLSILVMVLIYELILKFKMDKPLKFDREIVKTLLSTLDVDKFQTDIYEQNGWYGYRRDAIHNIIRFREQSGLLSNKTTDKKLNKLIYNLRESLGKFTDYSSAHLYGHLDEWYSPDKTTDIGVEKGKIAEPIMNKMTTDSYEKLKELINYLKVRGYL